jgi:hypothetical protein
MMCWFASAAMIEMQANREEVVWLVLICNAQRGETLGYPIVQSGAGSHINKEPIVKGED